MFTFRLSEKAYEKLQSLHSKEQGSEQISKTKTEQFCFAIATEIESMAASGQSGVLSLAHIEHILIPDQQNYATAVNVSDTSHQAAVVYALATARANGWQRVYLLNIHDHWFEQTAHFSAMDDRSDIELAQTYAALNKEQQFNGTGQIEIVPASVLITAGGWAVRLIPPCLVSVTSSEHPPFSYGRVIVNSAPIKRLDHYTNQVSRTRISPKHLVSDWHSRQPWMLDAQSVTDSLRVVLVGCGGTGSIAAEGMLRLGFKHLTLIDDDIIELHNLNRLQGAGINDVGKPKADVLSAYLRRLFSHTSVTAIKTKVMYESAEAYLRQADLVIGCVDNNQTRWFLNQVAVRFNIPYLDVGSRIMSSSDVKTETPNSELTRVSAVIPSLTPCGHCTTQPFFETSVPQRYINPAVLEAQRQAGYQLNEDEDGDSSSSSSNSPQPQIYALNLRSVSYLLELVSMLVSGAGLYRSDQNFIFSLWGDQATTYRLTLGSLPPDYLGGCALCDILIGNGDLPGRFSKPFAQTFTQQDT